MISAHFKSKSPDRLPRHSAKMHVGGEVGGGSGGVPQEWRQFRPRGKVFILSAIRAAETAKDIEDLLGHYVGIGGYMEQGGYSMRS